MKSHGYLEGVYVNGAPQGLTFHETEDYTIYPAPILSVTRQRFTKHYFIGDRRVASKIGAGIFQNAYGHGANVVTAGQKDYQMRMMQIEKQREDYYRKLGTPPGVPTMKGATAEPENTHEGYNTIIKELGDHSVPDGWIQRPKRNAVPGTPPGPPVQWDKAEDPDDVQPGYGYVPADTAHHEEIFFYHTDHLGSTSYITDAKANVAQFDAYLPYGELLVDEHSSTEEMPYKFNGKELDQETGLYYYGARYMNPRTSLWYGVDPLAEKYPNIGGYVYCTSNPVTLIDPDGKEIKENESEPQWLRYAKFVFKHPIATYRIGKGVTHGADDISTNSTRVATRGNVLDGSRPKDECEPGSENGAFRHTLWQATITPEFDTRTAEEAGNAHEDNPNTDLAIRIFSNLSEADQTVDLLNNQIGREIGQREKGKGMRHLAFSVLKEFEQKGLYTAVKRGRGWIVKKTRLSKDKYLKLFNLFEILDNRGLKPEEAELYDMKVKQKLESQQITWGTMK